MRISKRALVAIAALALCACTAQAALRVPDNYRPLRYTATENQRNFEVTWPFEAKGDVRVYVSTDEGATFTEKTVDVDFTIQGSNDCTDLEACGGNVRFVANHCDDASCASGPCYCTAGSIVMVERNDAIDRSTNMTTLTPEAVNLHLNRHTMQLQQNEDFAESRAVQLPVQDDYSGSGISPVLPSIVGNGGKAICATSEADGVEWCDIAPIGPTGPTGSTGATGPTGPAGADNGPYDIHFGVLGKPTDGGYALHVMSRSATFSATLSGSRAFAVTGVTSAAQFLLWYATDSNCGTWQEWGTLDFNTASGGNDDFLARGSWTSTHGALSLDAGDCVILEFPSPQDTTLADLDAVVQGNRP